MNSPFPGMDPFIEACALWEDFHPALIAHIKNALSAAVPARYIVRFGERSDAEPVPMEPFIQEEFRETFVEIYETSADIRLVTAIEVLSPSNKRSGSPGRDLYLRKRQGVFLSGANLVEVDLLRGGEKMPMRSAWPVSPYSYMVHRAGIIPRCQAWKAHFRRPLPPLRIPLIAPDPDVPLNLQGTVDAIYRDSRYDRSINYARSLAPALSAEDAAWFSDQFKNQKSAS